jgi:polysaccharide biosynthesis/export protein VpsN
MILRILQRILLVALMVGAGALLSGCATSGPNPEKRYEFPYQPPPASTQGTETAGTPPPPFGLSEGEFAKLRVGDLVIISFSDQVNPPPRQEIHIPDSGIITLPYNVHVQAAGKTTSQLEKDIRDAFVPGIFINLTVTVRTDLRSFFVDGEVKQPGRHNYTGVMTLLRAIGTAGGFTDFANRKNIELRRQTGQKYVVNYKEALNNAALDLPVYPNDLILIKRSIW